MHQKIPIISLNSNEPRQNAENARTPATINDLQRRLSKCSTAMARRLIDYKHAVNLNILPLGILALPNGEVLSVAASDPADIDLKNTLRFIAGKEIRLMAVDSDILTPAIFSAYQGDAEQLATQVHKLQNFDSQLSPLQNDRGAIEYRPETGEIGQFLAALVDYAIAHGASDIHFTPRRDGTFIQLRIDGRLMMHDNPLCSLSAHQQLANRVKILAALDTTIKSTPQDGSFSVPLNHQTMHVRVSSMPTVHGEKIVLRLIGAQGLMTLEQLGLPERAAHFIDTMIEREEGMMLFVGSTGSGKTTTLYAVMEKLSGRNLSLVSIEDPVELHLPFISQTEVNDKQELTFLSSLRSVLRQDPDVILVGEIRDSESAKAALEASLTGHLLLSTLHARNVFDVLLRLKNFGCDPVSTAQGLGVIVCQHLVPTLCPRCRVFDLASSNLLDIDCHKPVGCRECDYSGYQGRALACEALFIDEGLRTKIAEGSWNIATLQALTSQRNFLTLKESLYRLLEEGKISRKQLPKYLNEDNE